jgi:cytochrome c peroxidase
MIFLHHFYRSFRIQIPSTLHFRYKPPHNSAETETLVEAVKIMAALQLARELDDQTIADIVAFLKSMNHDSSL